jgi:hypothetical protein
MKSRQALNNQKARAEGYEFKALLRAGTDDKRIATCKALVAKHGPVLALRMLLDGVKNDGPE